MTLAAFLAREAAGRFKLSPEVMQREALDCEAFLLHLAQYWAVVCATRTDRLAGKDPADQRTTTVILRLYRDRQKIARGAIDGVEYTPETASLRIRGKAFEESIGKGLKRPFKIFSQDEPFVRSIKTFARTSAFSAWRKGSVPDLGRVGKLLDRFQREAFVDLRHDLRYVGVLVATKVRDGDVTIAFESLTPAQSRAYSLNLLKRFESDASPTELPTVMGCVVVRAGDRTALRAALGVPDIQIVRHPAVAASKTEIDDSPYVPRHFRVSGRPGAGKTTALCRMAENAANGFVVVLSEHTSREALSTFVKDRTDVVVVADDAHRLPQGALTVPMRRGLTCLATYLTMEDTAVRAAHPSLFAADVVAISLDNVHSLTFLKEVTLSIASRLHVGMPENSVDRFVDHLRGWDATPGGIEHYLQDFSGREWDEPGFWLRDDRHTIWENRFSFLAAREQTVLRLIAGIKTLGTDRVSYLTLRTLFVKYSGGSIGELDAAILSLRDTGWFTIDEPPPQSVYGEHGERFIETDWVRIPPNGFGTRGLFLDSMTRWSSEQGLYVRGRGWQDLVADADSTG
jgi:hypothetical protein